MLKIVFALFLVILSSCKTKYDTSKAVAILEETAALPDYRLKEENTKLDTTDHVVDIHDFKPELVKNLSGKFRKEVYRDGILYAISSKALIMFNLESGSVTEVKHSLGETAAMVLSGDAILLHNAMGQFVFINTQTQETIWDGTLNVSGFASSFVCIEEQSSCYALTIDGEIALLDYQNLSKKNQKFFQKNDIVLNEVYTPLAIDGKIVFAVGQSEFAIFDTQKNTVVAQSSFVEENASLFDINLVRRIYQGGEHVIIAHLNGSYAFNMLYGRPLWAKKFVLGNAFVASNYIIFYEEKTQKLISLHLETGEAKWVEDAAFVPLEIDVDYKKELVILEEKGLHLFELETGKKLDFKKINLHGVEYIFVHNHKIYYTQKGKVYQVK
jgi:hypothetical protein